jgi:hypothetical protein
LTLKIGFGALPIAPLTLIVAIDAVPLLHAASIVLSV